jgi:hypothetical protein
MLVLDWTFSRAIWPVAFTGTGVLGVVDTGASTGDAIVDSSLVL